jgi:hypothetical protein
MVDYVSYPSSMHHDFELYSNNQEQAMDYPLTNQPFMPSSTYGIEQSFNPSYDPMMPLGAQRPHDLHFHYDAIAHLQLLPTPHHTRSTSSLPSSPLRQNLVLQSRRRHWVRQHTLRSHGIQSGLDSVLPLSILA